MYTQRNFQHPRNDRCGWVFAVGGVRILQGVDLQTYSNPLSLKYLDNTLDLNPVSYDPATALLWWDCICVGTFLHTRLHITAEILHLLTHLSPPNHVLLTFGIISFTLLHLNRLCSLEHGKGTRLSIAEEQNQTQHTSNPIIFPLQSGSLVGGLELTVIISMQLEELSGCQRNMYRRVFLRKDG